MATKQPREPLKWEDISRGEQRGTEREISRIGKQTRSGTTHAVGKLRAAAESMTNSPDYKAKVTSSANRLEAATGSFQDKSITLKGAAKRRGAVWGRAKETAQATGGELPGAGWYLRHAAGIHAARGNVPFPQAAAASAALSPGKDPEADEAPAFKTLSELHQDNHTITVGRGKGAETDRATAMSAEQLGQHLSTAARENSAGETKPSITSTHPDLAAGGRAHKPNTIKAIKVLRGQIGSEEANPPATAPKTASYERNILAAGTASDAEKLDYMGIAHHAAHGDPNQGMMQFSKPSPGTSSENTILERNGPTAEDTWMQAISSGQSLGSSYASGRTMSPAKRAVDQGGPGAMQQFSKRSAGIPDDPTMKPVAYVHSFNNKATRMAAADVGDVSFNQHGEAIHVPSMMMQEVSWTQARREGGGDAPFNAAQRSRQAEFEAHARPSTDPQLSAPPKKYRGGGQQSLL